MLRPSRFGVLLTGLIVLISVLPLSVETVGIYEDEGIYESTAESLVSGSGYSIGTLPGSPPNAKYPFLYPAFLALLKGGIPLDGFWEAAALKLSNLPFLLILVWVFYRTLRDRFGWDQTVCQVSALLLGVCGSVVPFSMVMMTEIPFALVAWLFFRELFFVGEPETKPRWWLILLLGIVLYYLRTAGVALLASAVAVLFHKGRRRQAAGLAAGWIIAALPWIIWSRGAAAAFAARDPELAGLLSYYLSYDYHTGVYLDTARTEGFFAAASFAAGIAVNNLRSLIEGLGEIFFPIGLIYAGSVMEPPPYLRWVLFFTGGIAIFTAIQGYRKWTFPGKIVLGAATVFHTAMFILWPWPLAVRFLMPIIPVIFCFVVVQLCSWPEHWQRVRAVVITTSLGLQVLTLAVLIPGGTILNRFLFASPMPYQDALDWMRDRTTPRDVVLSGFTAQWIGRELSLPAVRFDTLLPPQSGLEMQFRLRPSNAFADQITHGLHRWGNWAASHEGRVFVFAEASISRPSLEALDLQLVRGNLGVAWLKDKQPVRIYLATPSPATP